MVNSGTIAALGLGLASGALGLFSARAAEKAGLAPTGTGESAFPQQDAGAPARPLFEFTFDETLLTGDPRTTLSLHGHLANVGGSPVTVRLIGALQDQDGDRVGVLWATEPVPVVPGDSVLLDLSIPIPAEAPAGRFRLSAWLADPPAPSETPLMELPIVLGPFVGPWVDSAPPPSGDPIIVIAYDVDEAVRPAESPARD